VMSPSPGQPSLGLMATCATMATMATARWPLARSSRRPRKRSGDVVYIEPGEEHWHGATPDGFMAHVAVQEADQNGQLTWDTSPGSSRWASNRALAR
jgi:hypothetical protein